MKTQICAAPAVKGLMRPSTTTVSLTRSPLEQDYISPGAPAPN